MNTSRAKNPSRLRVLLCESQVLVRQGLRCLLECAGFWVVAEVADGRDCLAHAHHSQPDVAVVDSRSCNSANLTKLLRLRPAIKLVVLTDSDDTSREAGQCGHAMVSKNADVNTLSTTLRSVCGEAGYAAPDEPPVTPDWSTPSSLKTRDWELLRLLATGRTDREIGVALGVAEKTVRTRLTDIFEQLGVRNRTEAALFFLGHAVTRTEAQPGAEELLRRFR